MSDASMPLCPKCGIEEYACPCDKEFEEAMSKDEFCTRDSGDEQPERPVFKVHVRFVHTFAMLVDTVNHETDAIIAVTQDLARQMNAGAGRSFEIIGVEKVAE